MMVTGGKMENVVQVGRYPCRVCSHGGGANSVLCKRVGSGVIGSVWVFQCPACCARGGGRVGCCGGWGGFGMW